MPPNITPRARKTQNKQKANLEWRSSLPSPGLIKRKPAWRRWAWSLVLETAGEGWAWVCCLWSVRVAGRQRVFMF